MQKFHELPQIPTSLLVLYKDKFFGLYACNNYWINYAVNCNMFFHIQMEYQFFDQKQFKLVTW